MKIDARGLRRKIERWTRDNCGWVNNRVLDVADIWRCPAELYDMMLEEQRAFGQAARFAFEEALHERDIVDRLRAMGLYRESAVADDVIQADFDGRVQGRIVGELVFDGEIVLLDIEAVDGERFEEVKRTNRALQHRYERVQMLMEMGGWGMVVVVYKARETGEIWPVQVWPHAATQERLVGKAREVLAAVDAGERPACECGRH